MTTNLHCWHDRYDDMDPADSEYGKLFTEGSATCMLPKGHEGPHAYTLDTEIVIGFE